LRLAVARFNEAKCEVVLFAGDLVSTFAVPPLRKLECSFVGCFGDNEGNKPGLLAGMSIVGSLAEPPVRYTAPDGTRFLLVHMERQARDARDDFDVFICGHTHKPTVRRDDAGRLFLNPGETSGWTFRRPTIALLETRDRSVRFLDLHAQNGAAATA
jgi:putative phosphoesterase